MGFAGFGRKVSWEEDEVIQPGHDMSFKEALHTVSTYLQLKLIAPSWAYRFSKLLRHVQKSNEELHVSLIVLVCEVDLKTEFLFCYQAYMREMIIARRTAEVKEERYDLFSALLDGSESDNLKGALNDDELIGEFNMIFIGKLLTEIIYRQYFHLPCCWSRGDLLNLWFQILSISRFVTFRLPPIPCVSLWVC